MILRNEHTQSCCKAEVGPDPVSSEISDFNPYTRAQSNILQYISITLTKHIIRA